MIIRPYVKEDSDLFYRDGRQVDVLGENDTVNIVNIGEFMGRYFAYTGDAWDNYVHNNAEKLLRPIGWLSTNVYRMIAEARKRID